MSHRGQRRTKRPVPQSSNLSWTLFNWYHLWLTVSSRSTPANPLRDALTRGTLCHFNLGTSWEMALTSTHASSTFTQEVIRSESSLHFNKSTAKVSKLSAVIHVNELLVECFRLPRKTCIAESVFLSNHTHHYLVDPDFSSFSALSFDVFYHHVLCSSLLFLYTCPWMSTWA